MCRRCGILVGTRPVYHTSVKMTVIIVLCFDGCDWKILLRFLLWVLVCSDQGRNLHNVELLKQLQDYSGVENHGILNNFCFYCPNPVLEPREKLLEYSERNCVYLNVGFYTLRNDKFFSMNSGNCFRIFLIELRSSPSYLLSFKHTALSWIASRQNDVAFDSKMTYIWL